MQEVKSRAIAAVMLFTFALIASDVKCEQLPTRTYTTADGLPRNFIQRIFSDSRGSLWFCTGDGLSFFNGYEFVTYGMKDGLPHTYTNDIIEDRNGRLWVATNGGGVCEFYPYTTSISESRFVVHKVGDSFATNRVNVLYEDRAGRIWAATDDGVFRLDTAETQKQFRLVEIAPLKGPVIRCFTEDKEGSLWIGSDGAPLVRLLPNGRALQYAGLRSLLRINWLLVDREGRLWIGTIGTVAGEGIYILRPEPLSALDEKRGVPWRKLVKQDVDSMANGSLELPQSPGDACQLTSSRNKEFNKVLGLLEARDGRVWVTTNEGVGEFDGRRFKIYTIVQGLTTNATWSPVEDRASNLWVASGEGVTRITLNSFTRYGESDRLISPVYPSVEDRAGNMIMADFLGSPRTIYRFDGSRFVAIRPRYPQRVKYFGWGSDLGFQHSSGEWWLVTGEGLCRFPKRNADDLAHTPPKAFYTIKDGLHTNDIFRIFEDSRGDVWVSGYSASGLLTRWDYKSETFHTYGQADGLPVMNGATAFCEDRFGNVWASFFEGGVVRYSGGRFTFFTSEDGLAGYRARALCLDRKGRLWIGTDTAGVARVDDTSADRPTFTYYSTDQGLAANNIISITEDRFGRIHLSHTRGIDRLDPETGRVRHYTAADGLSGEVGRSYCDKQGALWFGTIGGLYRLVPTPDEPSQPPPVFINKLRIAGRDYPVSETGQTTVTGFELPSNQNQIEASFFGLGFRTGERLRYQYLLEGASEKWSEPAEQRMVNFASLAPGSYRFLVRAVNADGVMSESPASFSFTILPAVWQRWWFVALVALALIAISYSAYRYRLNQKLEIEQVRMRIAADLHDDIGANLTKIAILSEVAHQHLGSGNKPADKALSSIADISRESVASMRDIVWAINPRQDRLLDLTRRMRRFASDIFTSRNIEFGFSAPPHDRELRLSPRVRRDVFLIFKEAVNNIARHSECAKASIEVSVEGGWLLLKVSDDGKGFDATLTEEGQGLPGMKQRAESFDGEIEFVSENGDGAMIRLRVPIGRRFIPKESRRDVKVRKKK